MRRSVCQHKPQGRTREGPPRHKRASGPARPPNRRGEPLRSMTPWPPDGSRPYVRARGGQGEALHAENAPVASHPVALGGKSGLGSRR